MNVVDLVIILFLLCGIIFGYKRGVIRQAISSIGLIIVVVLAFLLKNPVSKILYEHLPFFGFGGIFKGITVLNIFVYEVVAFLIVLSILLILLKVILFASKVVEKMLDLTIILGSLSSLLGAILGLVENFVIVFITLYVLSLPTFNINVLNQSKIKDTILNKTPILSKLIDKPMKTINEFSGIKEKYESDTNANEFNLETLDLFLKYDVVDIDTVDKLVENKKINIKGINKVLSKYRKEK